jgi:hypothetical protein
MATHVCSSDHNMLLRSKKINGRLRSLNTVVFSALPEPSAEQSPDRNFLQGERKRKELQNE